MATIYIRKRRKLTRANCIFLGVLTVFITVMLTFTSVSSFIKGEINIAGPIVMPLVSIPWPIFFFSKAKSLREAEEKKRADFLARKKAADEEKEKQEQAAKLALEQQPKLTPEQRKKEQLRAQKDAQVLNAYLQSTRTLSKVPIIVKSPAGEYCSTEDFVISWFEGKVCCSPAAHAQGLLLGKFQFRNKIWHFTNLAPEGIKTELGDRPSLAPGETCNVIPFPVELLYHTSHHVNAITSICAGWK